MSIRSLSAFVIAMTGFTTGASAATMEALAPLDAPPLKQSFIGVGASVVTDGQRTSCRVFSEIDVRASRYTSTDGDTIPFSEVTRSPAAGLWINGSDLLAAAPGGEDWRAVLKYPVDEITIQLGATDISANALLDPARDSVTFGPTMIEAIKASWSRGEAVRLIGISQDTGRQVVDTLVPPSQADLDACAVFESTFARADAASNPVVVRFVQPENIQDSTGEYQNIPAASDAAGGGAPEPQQTPQFEVAVEGFEQRGPISVSWSDRIPGTVDEARLTGCAMTDLGAAEIERYRVTEVTGFVSQSSEAWITRDTLGDVRQVYIPGVFEAIRDPLTETWAGDVSIAAFANDPFAPPVFKGCLGSVELEVTEPLEDVFALVLPEDDLFALQFPPAGPVTDFLLPGSLGSAASFPRLATSRSMLPGFVPIPATLLPPTLPFGPGPSSPGSNPTSLGLNPTPPVFEETPAVIPLPAAGWMLLAGLGALVAMRRRPSP